MPMWRINMSLSGWYPTVLRDLTTFGKDTIKAAKTCPERVYEREIREDARAAVSLL